MISLADRIESDRIKITTTYMDTAPDESGWMRHVYKVQLRRKGRKWTLKFYMGVGHTSEPDIQDVLHSVISDTSGYYDASGFWDWCAEYGYDVETPEEEEKHRKTYNAVRKQADRAEQFFGRDLFSYLHDTDWNI